MRSARSATGRSPEAAWRDAGAGFTSRRVVKGTFSAFANLRAREMFEAEPKRQRSSVTLAESAGRRLVAELDLQRQLEDWHAQLARYRAITMSGRRPDFDLSKLALEMQNTRRRMITEMQARGQGIGKSGAVTSLLRSLDRAIGDARSLL